MPRSVIPDPDHDPDITVVRGPASPRGPPARAAADLDPDRTVIRGPAPRHPRPAQPDPTRTVHDTDPDATVIIGGTRVAAAPLPDVPLPRPQPLALAAGFRLHEYRIDEVLGQGGFGITYLATDVHLNAKVAIKEYLPEEIAFRTGDRSISPNASRHQDRYRQGLDSFLLEARTLASFRHPAIVRVARFFEAHRTAYMVLEYEEGSPFKTWWPVNADLGETGLIELLLPLLDGLSTVHAAGFLHRDIKPDNIQLRRADGTLVLLDFGSAGQTVAVAEAGAVVLTPGYAPLEQYGLGTQGAWTDIYALGATLYWAVTGKKPPDAETRAGNPKAYVPVAQAHAAVAQAIGTGPLGEAFLRAIDWALEPEAARRPQSVAEFREALCADHSTSLDLQAALRLGESADEAEIEAQRHSRWGRWKLRVRHTLSVLLVPTAWPLAVKLTLAMLATALLPMGVTALYNLRAAQAVVLAGELKFVEQIAHSTAGRISQFITDNRYLARALASDADLQAALRAAPGSAPTPVAGPAAGAAPVLPATPTGSAAAPSAAALSDKLARIVAANPDVHRISLVAPNGEVLASSEAALLGLSFASERFFKDALLNGAQTTGLILGAAGASLGMVLAQPVLADDSRVLGVMLLRVRGSSVAAIVDEVRNDPALTPMLLDRDGVVIHHTQEDLIFSSLAPLSAATQAAIAEDRRFGRDKVESLNEPELAAAMVGARATGHVAHTSNISQREEILGFAPVLAHNWVLAVGKSRTDFQAPLLTLYQQLLWSVVLVGLLFAGLALLFARSIVRPVLALTAAANALKEGDFEHANVEVKRRDELGQLGRTFNVMIDVLRQRDREGRRQGRADGSPDRSRDRSKDRSRDRSGDRSKPREAEKTQPERSRPRS